MLSSSAFAQVPVSLLTGGTFIEIDPSRAMRGLPVRRPRALLVGQRHSTGTAPSGVIQPIFNGPEATAMFGRGSQLAQIVANFKALDDYTETFALPIDDANAGASATGTVTVTGPATAAGTIEMYIGGRNVRVGVAAADSANTIAAALVAAITADLDLLVTAAAVNAVVTLTSKHKGEIGNAIDVRHSYYAGQALPAGVGLAIVAMSGGTSDPSPSALIAAMGDARYDTIVWPWTSAAALADIKTELARRFIAMQMNDSYAHAGVRGSVGTLTTLGNLHNTPHFSFTDAGNEATTPWLKAAQVAARDSFEPDPARQRKTLTLPAVMAPSRELWRTRNERETLLNAGIATTIVHDDGTVAIERLCTNYKTNPAGALDRSYFDVTTMRTLAYVRWSMWTRVQLRFPRHKLANDDHPGGPTIARPKDIRAEMIALAVEWQAAGLIEDVNGFIESLQVVRDPNDANRVNILFRPDLVNNLVTIAALLQFLV